MYEQRTSCDEGEMTDSKQRLDRDVITQAEQCNSFFSLVAITNHTCMSYLQYLKNTFLEIIHNVVGGGISHISWRL